MTLDDIRDLPCFYAGSVQPEYLDPMGHMNVRWYITLFDEAAWKLYEQIGMTGAYVEEQQNGAFALEQHIRYLAELRLHEQLRIYARVLDHTPKRMHFMLFMVNESQERLAATIEGVGSHADLVARRTSPFPEALSNAISELVNAHSRLQWQPPLCGSIHA